MRTRNEISDSLKQFATDAGISTRQGGQFSINTEGLAALTCKGQEAIIELLLDIRDQNAKLYTLLFERFLQSWR